MERVDPQWFLKSRRFRSPEKTISHPRGCEICQRSSTASLAISSALAPLWKSSIAILSSRGFQVVLRISVCRDTVSMHSVNSTSGTNSAGYDRSPGTVPRAAKSSQCVSPPDDRRPTLTTNHWAELSRCELHFLGCCQVGLLSCWQPWQPWWRQTSRRTKS